MKEGLHEIRGFAKHAEDLGYRDKLRLAQRLIQRGAGRRKSRIMIDVRRVAVCCDLRVRLSADPCQIWVSWTVAQDQSI